MFDIAYNSQLLRMKIHNSWVVETQGHQTKYYKIE